MYCDVNFKTKAELKKAIADGRRIGVYNPGPFGGVPDNGVVSVEGPHYPKPHTWYARVEIKNGLVIKVLS